MAKPGNFQIFRYFAVSGALLMCVATALIGYLVYRQTISSYVKMQEQAAFDLTQVVVANMMWADHREFFREASRLPKEELQAHPTVALLQKKFRMHFRGVDNLLKVKLYDLNGKTIFSTDPKQIGDQNPPDYPGARVGQTGIRAASKLSRRKEFVAMSGPREDVSVLGMYLPVLPPGGDVQGVVELYFDINTFYSDAYHALGLTVVGATAILLFLHGLLLRVVSKGEKLLESQNRRIETQNTLLTNSAKMAALGEMAGGIAHEINNPLAIIKTLSGQLQELLVEAPPDIPTLREKAGKVEITASRIAEIVTGLRTFSRDGSNDPLQPFRIRDMVHETLSLCGTRFQANGTSVIVDEIEESLFAEGRATEISQVLLNLLSNANDAIRGAGEKWIRISVLDSGAMVEVRVTDSGRGLPADVREKLFQPFFTTKEVGKGTGLGLSISSGIIANHHGRIWVDTECPNTRFVFSLPKRAPARQAA